MHWTIIEFLLDHVFINTVFFYNLCIDTFYFSIERKINMVPKIVNCTESMNLQIRTCIQLYGPDAKKTVNGFSKAALTCTIIGCVAVHFYFTERPFIGSNVIICSDKQTLLLIMLFLIINRKFINIFLPTWNYL